MSRLYRFALPRPTLILLIALPAALAAPGATGCGDEEKEPTVSVVISGNHSVQLGATLALSAATMGGSDTTYTWSSSDSEIATVDTAGVVTAVSPGEVDIAARGGDTDAVGSHAVVVVQPGNPTVTVAGDYTVGVNVTTALTATTDDGEDSGYTWATSNDRVAIVDASGVVSGLASGEVTITATGVDSGVEGALGMVVTDDIPQYEAWRTSAHADRFAEAFNHWNEEDPAEIPTSCARCHSSLGYRDYIGADGSQFGVVDAASPLGTVVECQACHNLAAEQLTTVEFPSGVVIEDLGPEARCMTCHQGRSSTDDVDERIAGAGAATDDTVSGDLSFQNIHYYAAGATLNAGRVRGGYQYAGKVYDWRFRHVPDRDTCLGCHDQHSLKVRLEACATCHAGVTSNDDLKDIRMMASLANDYDGDGDLEEGIYYEMDGLRTKLLTAIQAYAEDLGSAICYDAHGYPYFFIDSDGDGVCAASEAVADNSFASWTPRLVRAAYNYQVSQKDPGAFAHNAKYLIQILYDSIEDLNAALVTPVDLTSSVRNDSGHFNGAGEPARHWDEDEEVSTSCSRCHGGAEGFRFFVEFGVGGVVAEPDNGLDCSTCHDNFGETFDLIEVASVPFPGGAVVDTLGPKSNICSTCHAGRTGKADIDASIAAGNYRFLNIHYLPAGATVAGSAAHVGYEYDGKTYAGQETMHLGGDECTDCHSPVGTDHTFKPEDNFMACQAVCHSGFSAPEDIRLFLHDEDYDGDGTSTERLRDEIAGMAGGLLDAMNQASTPGLCYESHSYPYFFIDGNASGGVCDASEASNDNRFAAWTPALMKAAHNFQYSQKEPGAWAHNFNYMAQLLFDSIDDLTQGQAAALGYFRAVD